MDDRNDIHSPDEQKNPMEIPSNEPESETQPIRASKSNRTDEATKHRQRMRGVKIAYAIALLFAVGGALTAKIATENGENVNLGGMELIFLGSSVIMNRKTVL